jgi:uncharacterized protein YkwD
MLKPIAAAAVFLAAFSTAAISQNNQTTASRQIQVAAYTRVRTVVNTPAAVAAAERDAFDLINKIRNDAGLESLIWNEQLANLARLHSQDMAEQKFFSHRGSDGSMVDNRADKLGLMNWSAIGENIAFLRGYDDAPKFAVERWMESPRHKENLLDKRWKETGMGVAILPDGTFYFTQVFILRN